MKKEHRGSYMEEINDSTLEILYDYSFMSSTWEQPEEESIDVIEVKANGQDITDFYFEFFDTDMMHDRILDYAMGL